MGQAEPTQMDSQPGQSSNKTLTQSKQGHRKGPESLDFNSNQLNSQSMIKNVNSNQNEKGDLENTDAEDIENIWLTTSTFEIFTNTQQIYGKQADFIHKDYILTVDFFNRTSLLSIFTSSQLTEQEKLQFLMKSLSSLPDFKVQVEAVILFESKIKKDKYFNLLNHIQGQLLICTLYPDAFDWQNIDEDPNIFDDVKNYRANIIFYELFCLNNFVITQNTLKTYLIIQKHKLLLMIHQNCQNLS